MKKLALLAVLLTLAPSAFAAGAGCSNTAGPLTLEKVRAGATGTEMFGCINRSLDVLSSSAVYSGTGSTATFKLLRVGQITGLSGGGGVWVSSNVTATSSMTLTGDIWLGGTIRSSVTMADAMSALTGSFGSSAVRPLPLAVMVTSTYGFSAGNLIREVRIGQYPGTDEPAIQGFKNNDQSNIVLNLNPAGGTVVVGGLGLYSTTNTFQSNGAAALNSSMLVGGPSSFSGSLTARSSMTITEVTASGTISATHVVSSGAVTFTASGASTPLTVLGDGTSATRLLSVKHNAASGETVGFTADNSDTYIVATSSLNIQTALGVVGKWGNSIAQLGIGASGICSSTASLCLNALPLAANAGAYFGGKTAVMGVPGDYANFSVGGTRTDTVGSTASEFAGAYGVWLLRTGTNNSFNLDQYYSAGFHNSLNITEGSVGIGTTNPTSALTLVGPAGNVMVASFSYAGSGNGPIQFYSQPGGSGIFDHGSYSHGIFFDPARTDIYAGGAAKLSVLDSGSVGIGTTAPIQKLDVAGNITNSGVIWSSGTLIVQGAEVAKAAAGVAYIGESGAATSSTRLRAAGNDIITLDTSNIFLGGASGAALTKATYTIATGGLALSGPLSSASYIQMASKTVAQLEAITPTATGQQYYCSNCLNGDFAVISTGTAVCQFAAMGPSAAWH